MLSLNEKKSCHPWWLDNNTAPRRSTWLRSTLSELDEKTVAMLKLIEQDADSFAQRAEMYYKKRPQLITMVEDFYRSHRSLAERYDMLKSETRTRLMPPMNSPSSTKGPTNKSMGPAEKSYDSYSETYSESGESEVDDPEEEETQVDSKTEVYSDESEVDDPDQEEPPKAEQVVSMVYETEIKKLRDEIERLKEENRIQKEQLIQKDDEKREVIRQLSLSFEILKENATTCKRSFAKEPSKKWTPFDIAMDSSKKWAPFEFKKVKDLFSAKFSASSKSKA